MGEIYESAFLTVFATDFDKGNRIFSNSAPQSFHVTEVGLLLLQRDNADSASGESKRIGDLSNWELDHLSHLDDSGDFTGCQDIEPFVSKRMTAHQYP